MMGPVVSTDNAQRKRKREIKTYTKSQGQNFDSDWWVPFDGQVLGDDCAIVIVPSLPNNNLVVVSGWALPSADGMDDLETK